MATVQDIMSRPPFGCFPDERAADALEYLQMLGIHAAPVLDDATGSPIGMIAISDLLGALGEATVRDRMSVPVSFVIESATVTQAAEVLVRTGYHHVVVVDAGGKATGFVSAIDLLRAGLFPPPNDAPVPVADELEWTAPERFSDAGLLAAPGGPGVLVLLRHDPGRAPSVTWVESSDNLYGRLCDLRDDPPPRLARLLESDRLRFRAAALADPAARRRVLRKILAYTATIDASDVAA